MRRTRAGEHVDCGVKSTAGTCPVGTVAGDDVVSAFLARTADAVDACRQCVDFSLHLRKPCELDFQVGQRLFHAGAERLQAFGVLPRQTAGRTARTRAPLFTLPTATTLQSARRTVGFFHHSRVAVKDAAVPVIHRAAARVGERNRRNHNGRTTTPGRSRVAPAVGNAQRIPTCRWRTQDRAACRQRADGDSGAVQDAWVSLFRREAEQ